jgi:hypothetical protein
MLQLRNKQRRLHFLQSSWRLQVSVTRLLSAFNTAQRQLPVNLGDKAL